MVKLIMAFLFPVFTQAGNITLTPENHVLIRNEINDDTVTKAQTEMSQILEKRGRRSYTIYLVLDSPGGSIDAGLNLIESFKTVKNLETITLFAASMASAVVEALPGKRNIIETGTLMFHRARGGVEGQFEEGELESRLNYSKSIVRKMEIDNSNRMGMSLAVYKSLVVNELWIFGKDALTKKAADQVVDVVCTAELIEKRVVENIPVMMGTARVEFSGCPLLKAGRLAAPSENRQQLQKGNK